jgi:hypothetical protein
MSKYDAARDVLIKAREEILRELMVCGQNGGTGRAQNYANTLVSIQGAIEAVDKVISTTPQSQEVTDRMAAVRAAKAK